MVTHNFDSSKLMSHNVLPKETNVWSNTLTHDFVLSKNMTHKFDTSELVTPPMALTTHWGAVRLDL